jgi:hypothetical protein
MLSTANFHVQNLKINSLQCPGVGKDQYNPIAAQEWYVEELA